MSDSSTEPTDATPEPIPAAESTVRRLEWVCLYFLSFGTSLITSLSFAISGFHTSEFATQATNASIDRYLIKILFTVTTLLLLYCVLKRRGQAFLSLGFAPPSVKDLFTGILLAVVAYLALLSVSYGIFYGVYYLSGGHTVLSTQTQNVGWLSGEGTRQAGTVSIAFMSVLRILLILLNPLHEEVVARAFTQTEWETSGKWSPALAAIGSAVLQGAYHLYQGVYAAIGVTAMFLCFATYFARQRRILPILLAHLFFDAFALMRHW